MACWKLVDVDSGRQTPCESEIVPQVGETIRIEGYYENGCHAWFLARQVIHHLIAPNEPEDNRAKSWGVEVRCKRQGV